VQIINTTFKDLPKLKYKRIIVDKGEPIPPLPENAIVYKWSNRNSDFYDVVEDTNEHEN
jgi:hypothetical protein